MRQLTFPLFLGALALGCDPKDTDVDSDGDGVEAAEDCDDNDASAYPGNTEACDGVDNDCDGDIDNGVLITVYTDADGDGYGDPDAAAEACEAGSGLVEDNTDCDDSDEAFNPGATEDDCTDPNDYNCDSSVEYADEDGDGFAACEDCNDADGSINGDADEVCDKVDNDCDGDIDEGDATDASIWYADGDGDGYGDPKSTAAACVQPKGYTDNGDDCDDLDIDISPAGVEICNGQDDDCDGTIAEPLVPTDHATITAALDAGETWICVEAGTYTEQIDFGGTDVVLESIEGPETTIIDGDGVGPVVSFVNGESAKAVFRGFQVTGGAVVDANGGGMLIENASPTLENLFIIGNTCENGEGAGLYATGSSSTMTDSEIADNALSAHPWGGGASVRDSDMVFDGVVFDGNSVVDTYPWGGGLLVADSDTILQNVSFVSNSVDNDSASQLTGSALAVNGGTAEITNAIFAGNTSIDSGGSGTDYAGALFVYYADVTITNASFVGNETSAANVLAQVVSSYQGTVRMVNVDMSDNVVSAKSPSIQGDAVGCISGVLYASYSNIYNAQASDGSYSCDSKGMSNMLSEDPMYTDTADPDPYYWDLTLGSKSALIDAGDPGIVDVDKTTSDIGAHGGPDGDSW